MRKRRLAEPEDSGDDGAVHARGFSSSAREAISSIAAARSSAPRACSVEAAAACREAVLASSAAAAICRAPPAASATLARMIVGPFEDRLIGAAQRGHIGVHLVQRREHGAVVLHLGFGTRGDLFQIAPERRDLIEDAAHGVLARSTFCDASRARLRMSLDTTAKPRPASPARAASTEPLTASMLVCTATKAIASTTFSIRRPDRFRAHDRRQAGSRVRERRVDAGDQPLDSRAALRQRGLHLRNTLVGVGGVVLCASLPLFSICDERGRGLLGGGRLLLRAAVDLLHRRHDLGGGARQLLNRRRKLLGSRADLLGGRCGRRSAAKLFGQRRERPRGCLSLIERLRLLLDRRLRLAGAGRLFFGRAGDLLGAFLRFGRRPFGLNGRVQHFLAPLRNSPHVFAAIFESFHDRGGRSGFRRCDLGRCLHRADNAADIDLDLARQALDLLGTLSEVSASARTSSATTAKPRPWSPARAASMAAFKASRLVWSEMRLTVRVISPMSLRAALQLGDDLDGRALPLRVALDRPHRGGDPLRRVAEHDLHGVGAPT